MQHPYSTKLTYKAKKGQFPAMRGELLENGIIIATFKRGATVDHFVPPIEYKFRSEASKYRFDDFADSLSIEETIEALI
jgi:hypothetical protein